ncbi:uncharacterized protein LOC111320041 [Stylophora pistillata]|uniref:uncharacterized protein LOC111320041 n=1 Tax=Stylophora pistillata TaxID=50429 RepID=UPI000C05675B|nr:uncharacterized protein LOC111320041 [Stylophora pistillata]
MTRKEVYQGNLFNKGLELCFVENKVEAFFLEIQGSGRIELDSGEHFYVTYAGQNGHPYRALGAVFLEKGLMKKEDISMASLKRFLFENPEGTQELMEENPSFVYFQENQEGVLGTGGVFLEGEYSLAVDERILPLGSLVWVETTLYDGTPFQRLMIALDTGGAIKGAGRGDIFFGFGEKAEHLAGHQNAPGRMVVLTPQRGKK